MTTPFLMISLMNHVGRISVNEFNALPTIFEAWDAIKGIGLNEEFNYQPEQDNEECVVGGYYGLLHETVGQVLIKHGLQDKFSVVLNHMHYELDEGENQVTCLLTEIENEGDLFYGEYLAEPMKAHPGKEDEYDLIPIKWRLNKESNQFESYEYLASKNISGTAKYTEIAALFEKNLNLQFELAQAIMATDRDQYFGILLQYYPQPIAKNCEINYEKDRKSKSAIFISNDTTLIKQHPRYKEIYESDMKLIETSWYFSEDGNIQSGGSCKGHGSSCGSHCYGHKK